jgi:hypothetical protein
LTELDRTPEYGAGWHAHLDGLAALLDGNDTAWRAGMFDRLLDGCGAEFGVPVG